MNNFIVTGIGKEKMLRRRRGLGPRLCGTCLCDRRSISISAVYIPKNITTHTQRQSGQAGSLSSGNISNKTNSKNNNSDKNKGDNGLGQNTVISISSHCNFCGVCVIDVDHHCVFLG